MITVLLLIAGVLGLYWLTCKYFPVPDLCPCDHVKRSTRAIVPTTDHPWADSKDPKHGYMTNSWWRYARFTARSRGHNSSCYVCSNMPLSVSTPVLKVKGLDANRTRCLVELARHPGVHTYWKNADFSKPLDLTGNATRLSLTCPVGQKLTARPQNPIKFQSPIVVPDDITFDICVVSDGPVILGNVTLAKCNSIWSHCPYLNKRAAKYCDAYCYEDPKKAEYAFATDIRFALTLDNGESTTCSDIAPTWMGTRVLPDWFWLCGHDLWTALPPDWGGVCSMVWLQDPTYVVSHTDTHALHTRSKRASISNGGSTIPHSHKLWSKTEKFFQSLLPWVGIGEVREEVEETRYRLMSFINASVIEGESVRKELTAIRLMVMQNRLVLDLLTAASGGVCVLIGEQTCCTYIPQDDADGEIIQQALNNMTQIRQELQNREVTDDGAFGWWDSLMSGWKGLLLQIAIPLVVGIFVFCIGLMCVKACISKIIGPTVNRAFLSGSNSVHYNNAIYIDVECDNLQCDDLNATPLRIE